MKIQSHALKDLDRYGPMSLQPLPLSCPPAPLGMLQ